MHLCKKIRWEGMTCMTSRYVPQSLGGSPPTAPHHSRPNLLPAALLLGIELYTCESGFIGMMHQEGQIQGGCGAGGVVSVRHFAGWWRIRGRPGDFRVGDRPDFRM